MKKNIAAFLARCGLALVLSATPILAQQQPAPRQMTATETTGALTAALDQANYARSMHIQAEARAAGLADELAKAQARIKELEAKPEAKP